MAENAASGTSSEPVKLAPVTTSASTAPKDEVTIQTVNGDKNFKVKGGDNNDLLGANNSSNGSISAGAGDDVVDAQSVTKTKIDLGTGNDVARVSGHGVTVNATGAGTKDITISDPTAVDTILHDTQYKKKFDEQGNVNGLDVTHSQTLAYRQYADPNSNIVVDARGSDTTVHVSDGTNRSVVFGDDRTKIDYNSPNKQTVHVSAQGNGYSLGIKGETNPVFSAVGSPTNGMPALTINGKPISAADIKNSMGGIDIEGGVHVGREKFNELPLATTGGKGGEAVGAAIGGGGPK